MPGRKGFWHYGISGSGRKGGKSMNVLDAIRLLETAGWRLVAAKGSHRQYKHSQLPGRVTVPGKLGDDLAPGTWNSIPKQAHLKGPNG